MPLRQLNQQEAIWFDISVISHRMCACLVPFLSAALSNLIFVPATSLALWHYQCFHSFGAKHYRKHTVCRAQQPLLKIKIIINKINVWNYEAYFFPKFQSCVHINILGIQWHVLHGRTAGCWLIYWPLLCNFLIMIWSLKLLWACFQSNLQSSSVCPFM